MPACSVCLQELSTKAILDRHMRKHRDYRPFFCTICGGRFTRKDQLNQHHVQIHSAVKPYKCQYCAYAAVDRSSIDRHTKSVHLKVRYECEVCGKSYSVLSRLNKHTKLHTGDGLFECVYCDKVFISKWEFEQHTQVHTRTEKDKWPCEKCGKTFAWKNGLKQHELKCDGPSKTEADEECIERKRRGTKVVARGRGTLTCLLCRGEFLSLPEMYRHQCPGTQ